MPDKTGAIAAAEDEAMIRSVAGWGFLGYFFPLVGILVVYLRSPKMSAADLARYDDQATARLYERHYIDTLKRRQVKATWLGVGLAVASTIVIIIIIAAAGVLSL